MEIIYHCDVNKLVMNKHASPAITCENILVYSGLRLNLF